ncbi:MAG: GFA family protein [Pseudomonadota bacterium]
MKRQNKLGLSLVGGNGMSDSLKGSCFCKAVQYEARGLLSPLGHCHCESCRKIHSAAFNTTALTAYEGFQWTVGGDVVASIESSPGKHRYFCPKCGTHLVALYPEQKRAVLRIGSLDSPLPADPVVHIWTSEKAPFFDFDDGLPRLPEGVPKS